MREKNETSRVRWHITGGMGCISETCDGCKHYRDRGEDKHLQRANCSLNFREERETEGQEGERTPEKLRCAYCEKEIDIDIPFANKGRELYHIRCIHLVYKLVPDYLSHW
jgi:hypothetical protein